MCSVICYPQENDEFSKDGNNMPMVRLLHAIGSGTDDMLPDTLMPSGGVTKTPVGFPRVSYAQLE